MLWVQQREERARRTTTPRWKALKANRHADPVGHCCRVFPCLQTARVLLLFSADVCVCVLSGKGTPRTPEKKEQKIAAPRPLCVLQTGSKPAAAPADTRTLATETKSSAGTVDEPAPAAPLASYFDVSGLIAAGLLETDSAIIYLRGECKRLLQELSNGGNVLIVGPPGTGKSVTAYLSCLQQRATVNTVWIHLKSTMGGFAAYVLVLPKDKDGFSMVFSDHLDVGRCLESGKFGDVEMLVIDGVRKNAVVPYEAWLKGAKGRRVVVVTSHSGFARIKPHEANHRKVAVDGWKREEYAAALSLPALWDQVKVNLDTLPSASGSGFTKEELIAAKFQVAGHSARWFFGFKTAEVEAAVQDALDRCPSLSKAVSGDTGDASEDAVNSLWTQTGGTRRPVSALVAKQLSYNFDDRVLQAFRDAASGAKDPALDGKVLELDFDQRLHRASKDALNRHITLQYEGEQGSTGVHDEQKWEVKMSGVFGFTDAKYLKSVLQDKVLAPLLLVADTDNKRDDALTPTDVANALDHVWLRPLRFNQGAYDFVRLRASSPIGGLATGALDVDVLQVTRAKDHDIKMWFVESLLEGLRDFVVPHGLHLGRMRLFIVRDSEREFKSAAPTASGKLAFSMGFKVGSKVHIVAYRRT